MSTQMGPWENCRCCAYPRPHMHDENGWIVVGGGGAGSGGHPGPYVGTNGGGPIEKPPPAILRLNLEIDVDDLTLIEFDAMTQKIKEACNLGRMRLRSIRQPKEAAQPHEEAQREARREILASLDRCIDCLDREGGGSRFLKWLRVKLSAPDVYDSKNMLAACREYLAAEEAIEAS